MKQDILEIVKNYCQLLDKHITDIILGTVDKFMKINKTVSELFVSHKHNPTYEL